MSKERIIGIDFGTSTSVIRVKRYQNGKPVSTGRLDVTPVKFNVSEDVAPTVIQKTPAGNYYGSNALVRKRGEEVFTNFKVDLESEDREKRKQARDLTAEYFTYLYQTYSTESAGGNLGDSTDREKTIVSYPVKWSDATKEFMLECACHAGFKNVSGIDEASAAIHAALVRSEDDLLSKGYLTDDVSSYIMLIDMGAGTTDIVICRYTPGKNPDFMILATWPQSGEALFGGHETDDILRNYAVDLVPEDIRAKVEKRFDSMKFKAWKESTVSKELKENLTVKSFVSLEEYVWDFDEEMDEMNLNRTEFESLADSYLAQYAKMISDSIAAAKLDPSQIDLVVLTGGHSQWYFSDEMLTDMRYVNLPKLRKDKGRIIRLVRPQETVAIGMVYTPIAVKYAEKAKPKPEPDPDPPKPEPLSKDCFKMRIDTVIDAVDTLICGNALQGTIKIGDHITIMRNNAAVATSTVAGLSENDKAVDMISAKNQYVELFLEEYNGIEPEQWDGLYVQGPAKKSSSNPKPKPDPTPVDTSWMMDDTGKTTREIHTMPTNREDIIKYYQRFGHHLIKVSANGAIYAVDAKNRLLSAGDPRVNSWTNITSVCLTFNNDIIVTKTDGTVKSTVKNYDNTHPFYRSQHWQNIAVLSGHGNTGLNFSGNVVGYCASNNGMVVDISGNCQLLNNHNLKEKTNDGSFRKIKGNIYSLCNIRLYITQKGKLDSTISYYVPKGFPPDTKIVSAAVAFNTIVAVTERGKILTENRVEHNAGPFDFSNWKDIIYINEFEYVVSPRHKNLCFIGITRNGRILTKEYEVKHSFLMETLKSCRLLRERDMGWQLF